MCCCELLARAVSGQRGDFLPVQQITAGCRSVQTAQEYSSASISRNPDGPSSATYSPRSINSLVSRNACTLTSPRSYVLVIFRSSISGMGFQDRPSKTTSAKLCTPFFQIRAAEYTRTLGVGIPPPKTAILRNTQRQGHLGIPTRRLHECQYGITNAAGRNARGQFLSYSLSVTCCIETCYVFQTAL